MNELVDIVYLFPHFVLSLKAAIKTYARSVQGPLKTAPIEIPVSPARCSGPDLQRHLL